jgi:tRNA (adenine57-N1/adenine58-N1)-methyltransferase catalytic subunit
MRRSHLLNQELDRIKEGDKILLFWDQRRQWLLDVDKERSFHTHKGAVKLSDTIGKRYGDTVQSALGLIFLILRPTTYDLLSYVARPTQIMYPKDIGLVLLKLGLSSGKTVIEAGTGSGAMTLAMANAVKPDGHVYSYEIRSSFRDSAKRTLRRAGLEEYVTLEHRDAKDGFLQREVDAALIDLGEPWAVIPQAWEALRGGAPIASFSPTINQVERTVVNMRGRFANVQCLETFLREIRAEEGKTRPATVMTGHTGYLTFGNKIYPSSQEKEASADHAETFNQDNASNLRL